MPRLERSFSLEKETKGTFRFAEDEQRLPVVGTIYVKKYTFPLGTEVPKKLRLTLEWED